MNNKLVVAIVILLSVGVFAWLVDYGWTHRYGSPETYELRSSPVLAVDYRSEQLDLNSDVTSDSVWQDLRGVEVNLHHQITEQPWPKSLTPTVTVQAFHNGTDIYFKITWQDDRPDSEVSLDGFADGCAVAVPLDVNAPPASIMMGFTSPVNIWHWRADRDVEYWQKKEYVRPASADFTYPFEQEEIFSVTTAPLESAVADLVSQRAGSLTDKPIQTVQGRGVWSDGKWSVVFRRALITDDAQRDCQFPRGKRLAAFAVWDGDQGDRGGRKSMSEWVTLHIEHSGDSKATHIESIRPVETSWRGRLSSLSLLASAHASSGNSQPEQREREPRVITVKAKRFEYIPNRIYVRQGQTVTLRMESLDVTHGLYLDGYGLDIKANPGLVAKATFVADKRGRFTFRCSETCGEFHPYMIGFLEVTPNRRFHVFILAVCAAFVVMLGILLRGSRQEKRIRSNVRTD